MASLLLVLISLSAAPVLAVEDASALIQSIAAPDISPLGTEESLDDKCIEIISGRKAQISTSKTVVWTLDFPGCRSDQAYVLAVGDSHNNVMDAASGKAVHRYFAAEIDDLSPYYDKDSSTYKGAESLKWFGLGDCYPVPVPKKGTPVYSWQLANRLRGGHCDPKAKVAALLETAERVDPVFRFVAEGPSQAQVASASLGDVSTLNGKCFVTGVLGEIATVADNDIVVWDPQARCPAGQAWIHYAGSTFARMTGGTGADSKPHHYVAAKVADAGDYELFVGDCYDTPTPVAGASQSVWQIANGMNGGTCP